MSDAWSKYRLVDGDILLNEGQSPRLVGRPAMYRGDPEQCAFTNSLIRFQAHDDVDPEWALLVFRRHLHFSTVHEGGEYRQRTSPTLRSSGSEPSSSRSLRLRNSGRLVTQIRSDLDAIDRMRDGDRGESEARRRRRRSILAAAFSGQLVPQDPSDEPASALLERIAAERATTKPSRRKKAAS